MKTLKKDEFKKYVDLVYKKLSKAYPNAKCHLDFENPFQLLISTVLAAQCTDIRVNQVMVPLYKAIYFSPSDILKYGLDNFKTKIKSINFYNNKAKAILALCEKLVNEFNGKVPSTIEDLVTLPGVGRKSASVIMGHCFNKKDVVIVDTHLKRVAGKLGLIKSSDPDKIENEVKEIIPPSNQFTFSMVTGEHGRVICHARKPNCQECFLNEVCPSAFKY